MNRFVDSGAKIRYTMADPEDWVEFRSELSYTESQTIESGALKGSIDKTSRELDVDIDWAAYGITRLAGWTVDWSFLDADGLKEPVTKAAIGRLNQATAAELGELLDAHIEQVGGGEQGKAIAEPS